MESIFSANAPLGTLVPAVRHLTLVRNHLVLTAVFVSAIQADIPAPVQMPTPATIAKSITLATLVHVSTVVLVNQTETATLVFVLDFTLELIVKHIPMRVTITSA